jgi:16S rRNA (guanine527-N7)-methyltransferase
VTADAIAKLLHPYIGTSGHVERETDWQRVHAQLAVYLELIVKWNARTNLTAIRTPEEIVRRHFGESLFAGLHLGECPTLLDFGSGAGFPGIPIQLVRPDIAVTLAESQGKKAAFLREVVRTLGISAEVWADRVEAMPLDRRFHTVALRAVDNMDAALSAAAIRAESRLLVLGTSRTVEMLPADFGLGESAPLPESAEGLLLVARRR